MVHATEKEQLDSLHNWWKENGSSILIGLLLGLSILLGGKAWFNYRDTQALNASNIYMQMLSAMNQNDIDKVRDSANQLIGNYSSSAYASFAALMLAKVAVTAGEFDAARAQLQWALEHARAPEIQNTARLRLARVLMEQKKFAEVRQLISAATDEGAFGFQYRELEGDVALAEGDTAKAAAAYRRALDSAPAQSPALSLLTTKYESVAGVGEPAQ